MPRYQDAKENPKHKYQMPSKIDWLDIGALEVYPGIPFLTVWLKLFSIISSSYFLS
jgi:hypothetical protein